MSDTPRTDQEARDWDDGFSMPSDLIALARDLERENAALRNEVARLNNQTNWVCKCGGTDCAGQKENAALRADKERIDFLLTVTGSAWAYRFLRDHQTLNRAAIDAGRKEAQP